MEKYFIVKNEKLVNEFQQYEVNLKHRNRVVRQFFEEQGIAGSRYTMFADGTVNTPCSKERRKTIELYIPDVKENREKFSTALCKGKQFGDAVLCKLRANSILLEAFRNICVEQQVVGNLMKPWVGDYFKETNYGNYYSQNFEYEGQRYLKIGKRDSDTITPLEDGLVEIKGSEYHYALEQYNNQIQQESTPA